MSPAKRITQVLTLNVSALSFGKLVALVSGAVTIAAALGGAARVVGKVETKAHAAATFVPDTAFRTFQQGIRETRIADSLNHGNEIRDVRRMLSGLDSSDRCRRGQSGFCR